MTAFSYKTRSEQLLEELETLDRALTETEQGQLRRCLHAVYMRHWRITKIEREANGAAEAAHEREEAQLRARVEVEAIATRMDMAEAEQGLPRHKWREAIDRARETDARAGSRDLVDAIAQAGLTP